MGMSFSYSDTADRVALTNLANAIPKVRREGLKKIGKMLVRSMRKWFRDHAGGGAEFGEAWNPLTAGTLRRHRRLKKAGILKGSPNRVGIVRGQLVKSITSHVTGASKVHVYYSPKIAPYRNAFAAQRTLFPSSFPPAWIDQAEQIADQTTKRAIERMFS